MNYNEDLIILENHRTNKEIDYIKKYLEIEQYSISELKRIKKIINIDIDKKNTNPLRIPSMAYPIVVSIVTVLGSPEKFYSTIIFSGGILLISLLLIAMMIKENKEELRKEYLKKLIVAIDEYLVEKETEKVYGVKMDSKEKASVYSVKLEDSNQKIENYKITIKK